MHPSPDIFQIYLRFGKNLLDSKISRKEVDYSTEQFYWERIYYKYNKLKKHPYCWDSELNRTVYSNEMTQILDILSEDFAEDLKLADIGSGPISSFIYKINICKYSITTVDPLAKIYNYINFKYNPTYPLKCIEGTGEQLTELFSGKNYHLVLTQNAIDHSIHPLNFMNNLFYILKPKGFLYLCGYIDVGKETNWIGLHQHNISIDGDDLIWSNRSGTVKGCNITGHLDMSLFSKDVSKTEDGAQLYIMIYKKK